MSERFLFDQEFDEHGRPRPRARDASFCEDDLAAARAQGYADGEQAGQAAAAVSIDANAASALEQVAAGLAAVAQDFRGFADGWQQDAAGIAVQVGRKLAERLIAEQPLAEIEAMVVDCVNELHEEPRLVIRTSTPVAEQIAERLGDIARKTGFEGHLVILPDETMSDQDCRIEWAQGGVERTAEATGEAINRAVEAFMADRSATRNQDHV